jgi:hypothetical protein
MDVLPAIEPKMFAVSFRAKTNPEERVLAVAAEDGTVLAYREADPPDETPAALSVMHIATSGAFRLEDRRKTEEWLNSGKPSPAVGDALMQSDQIRLRGDRALIIADAKRLEEYLPGLAVFAYNEKQISDMEVKIARLWGQMGGDIPLIESSRFGMLGRQSGIDALVADLARTRMSLTAADQAIYLPAPTLSPTAQRLQNELALTSRHADRVEALDERLEVLEDNYEGISDRMHELKLHRRELIAEWMIVLLLCAEALALLYPLLAAR